MEMQTTKFKVADSDEEEIHSEPPPVPPSPSERVAAALAQRVEIEQMRMAGSWARMAAQNSMQASLDIHRALQTARIAMTVGDQMRDKLVELGAKTEKAIAKHPALELDFLEMQLDTGQLLKQLNKVIAVGYLRRYHRTQSDY